MITYKRQDRQDKVAAPNASVTLAQGTVNICNDDDDDHGDEQNDNDDDDDIDDIDGDRNSRRVEKFASETLPI